VVGAEHELAVETARARQVDVEKQLGNARGELERAQGRVDELVKQERELFELIRHLEGAAS
jgi:hypothetical protein